MIAVAIIGLLAAVAVPAYNKYVKKAKTAEARDMVKKAYDGARAYYMDRQTGGLNGAVIPAQFPLGSPEPAPSLGTCCVNDNDRCEPDIGWWASPQWVALQFSVVDPHYFSYVYDTNNPRAGFQVRAHGDLDCDGEYSTFEMRAIAGPAVDPLTGVAVGGAGTVMGQGGLYREAELE